MAWLQKRGDIWWVGYRINGKQVRRSTGESDKAKAEAELAKVELMFGAHAAMSLTEELYQNLTGAKKSKLTLVAELDDWLKESQHQTEANTWGRYKNIADEFKSFLNATEKGTLLDAVTSSHVSAYLMEKRKSTAASTTNVVRKILAGFFKRAVKGNRLKESPVSPIKIFKAQKNEKVQRRSFTVEECKMIYEAAPTAFWKYMILGAAYTGLRMGDLINVRWSNVDLESRMLRLQPDKTDDKFVEIPLRSAFHAMLAQMKLKAGKVKPSDYLWPDEAEKHATYKSKSGYFSNQFYSLILEPCGLVPKRTAAHKAKPDSNGKRAMNDISFHCLRHFFISQLKSTGSSQAVAKQMAGHSSDQISDLYTHVSTSETIKAFNDLPEFTK